MPTSSSPRPDSADSIYDTFEVDPRDSSPFFAPTIREFGCVCRAAVPIDSRPADHTSNLHEFSNAVNASRTLLASVQPDLSELLPTTSSGVSDAIFHFQDLTAEFENNQSNIDDGITIDEVADFESDQSGPDQDNTADEIAGLHELVFFCAAPMNSAPKWTMLPNISKPTVFIDKVLEKIVRLGTQLSPIEITTELSSSLGAAIAGVLRPGVTMSKYPLCAHVAKWMLSDFGKDFAGDFPDFVGLLYVIYALIRWRAVPSERSYGDLPEWMKPTRQQIQRPHALWIDIFPWPKGRAKLVETFKAESFHTFRQICIQTVSVNWLFGAESIILWCPTTKDIVLTPSFEKHIRSLENWTIGPLLREKFPEMTGLMKEGLQSRSLQ
jgi:hypothetical protein